MFKRIILFFLIIILIVPFVNFISILRCEYVTSVYGEEIFDISYSNNKLDITNGYYRILSFDDECAIVYEANKNRGGFIWEYHKINGEWSLAFETPICVWTKLGGNAAETIWPYWWHFIYW